MCDWNWISTGARTLLSWKIHHTSWLGTWKKKKRIRFSNKLSIYLGNSSEALEITEDFLLAVHSVSWVSEIGQALEYSVTIVLAVIQYVAMTFKICPKKGLGMHVFNCWFSFMRSNMMLSTCCSHWCCFLSQVSFEQDISNLTRCFIRHFCKSQ